MCGWTLRDFNTSSTQNAEQRFPFREEYISKLNSVILWLPLAKILMWQSYTIKYCWSQNPLYFTPPPSLKLLFLIGRSFRTMHLFSKTCQHLLPIEGLSAIRVFTSLVTWSHLLIELCCKNCHSHLSHQPRHLLKEQKLCQTVTVPDRCLVFLNGHARKRLFSWQIFFNFLSSLF